MGLNDSFAQVRSKVLLLDPLPPINHVFALIIQEERQRTIGNHSKPSFQNNSMTFALKGDAPQSLSINHPQQKYTKGRPFCTSCNIPGHTVDTCYKIHGYPPGYKNRNKYFTKNLNAPVNQLSGQTPPVNQISGQTPSLESHGSPDVTASNFFQNLDKTQLDQWMAIFVQHLSTYEKKDIAIDGATNYAASGTCLSILVPNVLQCMTIFPLLDCWFWSISTYLLECKCVLVSQTHN